MPLLWMGWLHRTIPQKWSISSVMGHANHRLIKTVNRSNMRYPIKFSNWLKITAWTPIIRIMFQQKQVKTQQKKIIAVLPSRILENKISKAELIINRLNRHHKARSVRKSNKKVEGYLHLWIIQRIFQS